MNTMESIQCVWNSGSLTPNDTSKAGDLSTFYEEFKSRTGSAYVAKLRWQYMGKTYECDYPAEILPDHTAAVTYGENVKLSEPQHYPKQRSLKVLNPDGVIRCHVNAPVIDASSVFEKRWIQLPRNCGEYGIPWGVPACDGWRIVVMDVDWSNGQMKRWVLAPDLDR